MPTRLRVKRVWSAAETDAYTRCRTFFFDGRKWPVDHLKLNRGQVAAWTRFYKSKPIQLAVDKGWEYCVFKPIKKITRTRQLLKAAGLDAFEIKGHLQVITAWRNRVTMHENTAQIWIDSPMGVRHRVDLTVGWHEMRAGRFPGLRTYRAKAGNGKTVVRAEMVAMVNPSMDGSTAWLPMGPGGTTKTLTPLKFAKEISEYQEDRLSGGLARVCAMFISRTDEKAAAEFHAEPGNSESAQKLEVRQWLKLNKVRTS